MNLIGTNYSLLCMCYCLRAVDINTSSTRLKFSLLKTVIIFYFNILMSWFHTTFYLSWLMCNHWFDIPDHSFHGNGHFQKPSWNAGTFHGFPLQCISKVFISWKYCIIKLLTFIYHVNIIWLYIMLSADLKWIYNCIIDGL